MKKLFLLYIAVILAFAGCQNRLDLFPRSSVTPETITPDDIPNLLNGLYAGLRDGNTYYWCIGYVVEDIVSDNLIHRTGSGTYGEIDNNTMLASNAHVNRYWSAPYSIIQKANDILEVIDMAAGLTEDEKKALRGEVRAVRGYAYYRLVTLFGGVPIIESRDPEKQIVPREPEDKVWQYIIDDLTAGLDAQTYSDKGAYYMSREAAKLLLARVQLVRGNNSEARRLAEEVIASPLLALTDDFNKIWDIKGPNNETVFAVQATSNDGNTVFHGFYLSHSTMPAGGRAEFPVDRSILEEYEPDDQRLALIYYVPDPSYDPKAHYYSFKYQAQYTAKLYVARTAEAYLISAEASYKLNPSDELALKRINELRKKRGASQMTSLDLYDIISERRRELAFEGYRWTDMKRTPSEANPSKSMALVFLESKGRTANDLLFPVPTAARDVNPKLEPNPGY